MFEKQAWLLVATGGRWSLEEILKHLVEPSGSRTAKFVREHLTSMVTKGMLHRYEDGALGVTGDCVIPTALCLNEVLPAIGVRWCK